MKQGHFVVSWVGLETEYHKTEVRKRKTKQISSISTCVWNLEKLVQMNLFAGQEKRHRHQERTGDTVTKGEGGMTERAALVYIHTTVCKQITSDDVLYA